MPETINRLSPAHITQVRVSPTRPQVINATNLMPAHAQVLNSSVQQCAPCATCPAPRPITAVERAAVVTADGNQVDNKCERAGTPPSPPCSVVSPYLLSEEQMRELNIPEGLFSLYSHFYYQSCFGLRTWYPSLRQFTLETEFLQLSDIEIDAVYERCCASHAVQDNLAIDDGSALSTAELRNAWVGLKKRIDGAMAKFPQGVFVRLDTRSTKDAPTNMINVTRVRKQILSAIEKMQHACSSIVLDPKQALEAFMDSSASAMRATNADEVLQLLRYSHQVREDFATLRRLRGLGIPCILALRRWDQEMATRSEWEFRAFVHDNVITGISQLNHTVLNRELLRQRQAMNELLQSFIHTTILPALPHKTFIVDLFFSPTTRQLQVVGLNPFESTTCACLFDWRKDSSQLLQGPCQFRIVEATPAMFDRKGRSEDIPMEVIPPKWARVLQAELGCLRFDEHFAHPSLDTSGRPMRTKSQLHLERTIEMPPGSELGPSATAINVRMGNNEAREIIHRTTDRQIERERRAIPLPNRVPNTLPTQSASAPVLHHGHHRSHRGHANLQGSRADQMADHPTQQRDHKKAGGCIIC